MRAGIGSANSGPKDLSAPPPISTHYQPPLIVQLALRPAQSSDRFRGFVLVDDPRPFLHDIVACCNRLTDSQYITLPASVEMARTGPGVACIVPPSEADWPTRIDRLIPASSRRRYRRSLIPPFVVVDCFFSPRLACCWLRDVSAQRSFDR